LHQQHKLWLSLQEQYDTKPDFRSVLTKKLD